MTVVFSPGLPQGLSYSGLTPLMHGQQDMASTYAPGVAIATWTRLQPNKHI